MAIDNSGDDYTLARTDHWQIIRRPGPPTDGWFNFWIGSTAWSKKRVDRMVSFNVETRRFADSADWKYLHTKFPATAKWIMEEIRRSFPHG